MKTMPTCLLYSCDEELIGRIARILTNMVLVVPIAAQEELEQWLAQFGDAVLLADLRAPNCLDVLSALKTERPLTVVVAIGADRSDPMLAAEWLEPFATIGFEPDRRAFQSLLKNAIECLQLRRKSRLLEDELAQLNAIKKTDVHATARTAFSAPLQNFSGAQKNFDNLDRLFESVVEGLVAAARVSRAGIFIRDDHGPYRFQAGMRCLGSTETLTIECGSPFVRWLEMNTHLVSRKILENIRDPQERMMLRQTLDAFGAEIIIPLYASGGIKGWIFVGQRATGIPFEVADLEDLTGLADHISTTLEKALQYEKTALQKALAETLLHSIPFGIVACDENAVVRWFNSSAGSILGLENEPVIGSHVEQLGSRIADLLRRALTKEENRIAQEWDDPRTRLTLSAETRHLRDGEKCVGAMMMLRDVTGARLIKEKEEQVERATFWNELAASMSHEIRNPLVAIKTFAQLLPERYDDPEFRANFSEQVSSEVDRLNQIIDKINEFANPPRPIFQSIDVRKPIERAVSRIQAEFGHDNLKIHLSSDDALLKVNGDESSLEECIYHLLRNSAENLGNKPGSRVNVTVKSRAPQNGRAKLFITVADNGGGIDESVRDKIFSPFSTIKARGLGLGLPIAKRAVVDHSGQINIETSAGGTTVMITLPALNVATE